MTPKDFTFCIRREILESNLQTYHNSLENSVSSGDSERSHWPQMTKFYRSLNVEQRKQFIQAIAQVSTDTISNLLGVLDGSTLLEKHRDYFHLTYGDNPKELNGDLQGLFLSKD